MRPYRALRFCKWLRGLDLNQRPLGYEPNELPGCSTPHLQFSNLVDRGQRPGNPSLRHPSRKACNWPWPDRMRRNNISPLGDGEETPGWSTSCQPFHPPFTPPNEPLHPSIYPLRLPYPVHFWHPVKPVRKRADVSALCCCSDRHCRRAPGSRALSHLSRENQGRLPGGGAFPASGSAGAYAADFVDWRRVAVCGCRERLSEWFCCPLAAGRRLAGIVAHLLHRAACP